MKNSVKKIIISSGLIVTGILFFFYLLFLVYLGFKVIPPSLLITYNVKDYQIPLFILFFVLFVTLFVIYTFQLIKKKQIDTLLSKYDFVFFILYSLLFIAFSFCFKILIISHLVLFIKVSAGLSLIFLTSITLRRVYNFLLKPVFINLFFKRAEILEFLTRKVYWILDLPNFLKKSHLMLNQCKRFGLNVGFIGIYIKNLPELEKKYGIEGAKFI
ncbi:MAG: hypothetical protein JW827_01205, partial [Spirochaetes bacterium]|nr:hypothetical protein [Spirochaetota bacterium]